MRRRRRPTLHHAVKDKRVTVLGPVKQPEMDFMSHRGVAGFPFCPCGVSAPPPFPFGHWPFLSNSSHLGHGSIGLRQK